MTANGGGPRRTWQVALPLLALAAGVALYLVFRDTVAVVSGATFPIPYDPTVDVTRSDRVLSSGGLRVELAVLSRPLRPVAEERFRVRILEGDRALAVSEPELTLNMKMDMGRFVYTLLPGGDGLRATVKLPSCGMGGKWWFGRLRFRHEGAVHELFFLFDMDGEVAPGQP